MSHKQALDELFAQMPALLEREELPSLERVMHDGTKVRAQAGADSFRREKTAREHLERARKVVREMGDPRKDRDRREAARQRGARETAERLERAAQELAKIRAAKDPAEREQARVSLTEPDARRMKHGGQAIAPSYNLQIGPMPKLSAADAAAYQRHIAAFFSAWKPSGGSETRLVQSLADIEWRLLRILEMGIYAAGRLECAESFPDEDEAVRKHLVEAKVFLAYQRQLNNLSIQENRLRRQREKDTVSLRSLQDERKRQSQIQLDKAARAYIVAVHDSSYHSFDPAEIGFEFSLGEIELRAMDLDRNLFADYERQLAQAKIA